MVAPGSDLLRRRHAGLRMEVELEKGTFFRCCEILCSWRTAGALLDEVLP
jgi:hypothetical protein